MKTKMILLKKRSRFAYKRIFASFVVAALVICSLNFLNAENYFEEIENAFLKILKLKFSLYTEQIPEDRVYMQFDKPFYQPGETVWFSAYVRNAETMKPSEKSDILHVELISPKGSVDKEIKLVLKNGKVSGDFFIDEETNGGLYKVRAYTNWQKNEENAFTFEKEIQVQDVVLPNLKMKLDFERKAFGSGDDVIAKLELNTNENTPLSNYDFKYIVNIEGQKILENKAVTGNEGEMYLKFKLPYQFIFI